jgi:FAD binding domain-like
MFPYLSFFLADQLQALGYPIPGMDDELRTGHRRYNFAWYRVADAAKLQQMCVDDHGHEYEFGMPPPVVRKDLVVQMRAEAESLLPPQYLDCLQHIDFSRRFMIFARPSWYLAAWHWWGMRPRHHVLMSVLASRRLAQRRRRWQKRFRITMTLTGRSLPTTPLASLLANASSRTAASWVCSLASVSRPMKIAGSQNYYKRPRVLWIGLRLRISWICEPSAA